MEPMKDIQAGKRAEMGRFSRHPKKFFPTCVSFDCFIFFILIFVNGLVCHCFSFFFQVEAFWKADLKTISLIDPSTHRLSFQRHASKNQSSLLPNQCSLAVETAYNTSLPRCAMLKQEFRAIDDMLQDTDNKDCLFIQRRYNAMILVMNVVRDIYHRLGTELAQDFKRIHRLIEKPLEHHSEKGPLGPFSVDAWHNRWLDNVVIAEKCERDLKAMHAQYVSAKKELQMISERMESSYQDSSQNSGPLTASSYVSLHNKVGMSAHNDQLLKV